MRTNGDLLVQDFREMGWRYYWVGVDRAIIWLVNGLVIGWVLGPSCVYRAQIRMG